MLKVFNQAFEKYPLTVGIGTFACISIVMLAFMWHLKPDHMIEIAHTNMSQQ